MIAARIERLMRETPTCRAALLALHTVNLPDAWIAAGLVRNAVWDERHGFAFSVPEDIDLIYFDPADPAGHWETEIEAKLRALAPDLPWSVRNQARMHARNGHAPYLSSTDAMAHWVETATAVGVRLGRDGSLEIDAPHGLADLDGLILRPGPAYRQRLEVFHARQAQKRWLDRWPMLRMVVGERAGSPRQAPNGRHGQEQSPVGLWKHDVAEPPVKRGGAIVQRIDNDGMNGQRLAGKAHAFKRIHQQVSAEALPRDTFIDG